MPSIRHVSLVQKLKWHVSGNISPTAFAIGDVDGHGDNSFVIGNLVGDLFIFKGNHPDGQPWLTCKGLGTITAVAIGDIRNWGKNSIVVLSAEGLCHIFDVAGIDDDHGSESLHPHGLPHPTTLSATAPGLYSSTPAQGSYYHQQYPASSVHHQSYTNNSTNSLAPNVPATPNIRPVPDLHHYHPLHGNSHNTATSTTGSFNGTPPIPATPHNTPHGSSSSSISGFPQLTPTSTTPVNSAAHVGSVSQGGNVRRGSEVFPASGSASVRATTILANLIGTPPSSSSASHGHGHPSVSSPSTHHHQPRPNGGGSSGSALNSPTGTPQLRPQQSSSSTAHSTRSTGINSNHAASRDTPFRKSTGTRHNGAGKTPVHHIGGRRVLDRANLTLPVPVNINRAHIADIDGDGLNELVLARTDRILHSYALQSRKPTSPTTSSHPSNQPLSLMKLLSRTSSISTLDSSGLFSPAEDRKEPVIHFPSLAPSTRQFHSNSTTHSGQHHHTATTSTSATSAAPVATPAAGSDTPDGVRSNDYSASRLTLEEKKRWALDGQIHSLSVTKNASTGLPILLVAQPGLKFVMVDHAGMMSEPLTQVQRDPSAIRVGPDTPTRGAGGGDVATDIVCGTQYVNGQKKEIIGLMSMDGAFALHDLENNSVRLHDLDSTHKIFGFSKLNFGGGGDSATQQDHHHNTYADYSVEHKGSRRSGRSKSSFGYGWSRGRRRYENETNDETDDGGLASDDEAEDEAEDDDDEVENDDDTATETTNHRASKQNHGDGDQYSDTESRGIRQHRTRAREHRPSLLIAEPHRSRSQMNDLFVGCSWSGNTFFIDQEFNTAQYDFDGRVCAFGAGEFAVTPGRNEPCVFYVDFEDNIYVYYNLYIQTQSLDQFQNIIREDDSLIKASQQIKQAELEAEDMIENRDGISAEQITQGKDTTRTNMIKRGWTEEDMKSFIHDSLYNVNRYEDEYQRLKRLAAIERSKRAAFYAAEEAKAREKLERAQRQATDAVASASTVKAEADDEEAYAEPSRSAAGYIDPRLGRFRHGDSTITDRRRAQQGPAGFDTTVDQQLRSHSRPQSLKSSFDDRSRSRSPNSPTSPTPSPKSKRGNEKRRSSLLIKDVLSHYEGKVTPPLKSPTSPTTSSEQQFSKGHKSGTLSSGSSSGSSASLTNIMKRFSLKDIGNGSGRMSRISSAAGGGVGTGGGNASSSSSSSGGSNSTVIASHHLLGGVVLGKGKTLETRAGKSSLRVNRPVGVPRSRSSLGVMGRKHGAKSRLSHQQVRDDGSEEVDDEGLERTTVRSDGAADLDREQMIEFERSHGLRGSNRIYGERGDEEGHETDMGSQAYYPRGESRGGEGEGEYDREDDTNGVYTPSTISPMPSPGRLYSSHYTSSQYGTAEPSPSLDGSVFTLAGSLLSPSANKTGAFSAATTTASHPPSHSQGTSSSGRPSSTSTSTSRGHSRHRSGHELLDYNLAPLPTREIVASVGINSGPNSAGHSSNHDGRRSRAESVLSAGSDIGGVIVPDITLLASSFPSQSNLPLSTSEPYSHGVLMMPQDQEDEHRAFQEGHSHQQESDDHQQQRSTVFTEGGIRRPPRRSATLGSGHGSGSGSDSAAGPSKSGSKRDSSRLGKNGAGNSSSSSDIKLMPAPLPRSNQHHQRQQQGQNQEQHRQGEPPTSTGSMIMSMSSKDLPTLSSSHISFSTNTAGGGGGSQHGHGHGSSESHEGSGFVRGPSGKSPSTTSSTNASEFGSGPSSPLTANVSASAILSNPSTSNNYKGIGILSLPVTSPAGSTTSAHQYFGGSHHPTISSLSTGKSGAQTQFAHDHHDHHQRVGQHHLLEDDRMSIRSKTSLYRGRDREDVDADSLLDHESVGIGSTSVFGASPRSSLSHHHQQQQHQSRSHQTGVVSSVGSSHLVSDSLVHRLEELQRQDHEQEEKQRRKKELEKDSEQEKERDAAASKERGILKSTTSTTSAVSSSSTAAAGGPLSSSSSSSGFGHVQQQQHQQDRPTVLSRANSGTSILSVTTTTAHAQQHHNHQHHHSQSNLPLTSHGSGSGTGRTHWGEEDHDSAKRLKNRLGLGQGL